MDCSVVGTKQINITYSLPIFFPKETGFFPEKNILHANSQTNLTFVLYHETPGYTQAKCFYIFVFWSHDNIFLLFFNSLFTYFSVFVLESLIHYHFLFNCVLIFFQVCQPFGKGILIKIRPSISSLISIVVFQLHLRCGMLVLLYSGWTCLENSLYILQLLSTSTLSSAWCFYKQSLLLVCSYSFCIFSIMEGFIQQSH